MAGQSSTSQITAQTPSENQGGFAPQVPTSGKVGQNWGTPDLAKQLDLLAATLVLGGFVWRVWLAHATFFNTDEAWHYSVANQDSLAAAYKASLTLLHPPLLVLVVHYWRHLGTSDLWLRFPSVIAGTMLCWAIYKWLSRVFGPSVGWVGLMLVTFLPPIIALSAELRQYTLVMVFAVCSACLLEDALASNSTWRMVGSCLCLYLALLSHYSAFLFAAALGIYGILRIIRERPRAALVTTWFAGQLAGIGLGLLLYFTQIKRLRSVYAGAQPLNNYANWYLADWYFHPGRDRLLPFLYRGTLGVFRFTFGQTAVGQIAAILFVISVVLLLRQRTSSRKPPPRLTSVLLLVPFVLSWFAVRAGLYPFGRTRQCVFLALFVIAGVSVALVRISGERVAIALVLAIGMVIVCQARGTLQGRDMLPLAEQRHEHMDKMVEFLRRNVSPNDVIYTDQATSFQLRHYLCNQKPVSNELLPQGFESFRCEQFRVVFTGPNDGALTAEALNARRHNADGRLDLNSTAVHVWVAQGGWASGLGEELQRRLPLTHIDVHSFGRYLEVIELPDPVPRFEQG
jgi:Dolichyl-phosphate-mannose-protein mannosyltransferase